MTHAKHEPAEDTSLLRREPERAGIRNVSIDEHVASGYLAMVLAAA